VLLRLGSPVPDASILPNELASFSFFPILLEMIIEFLSEDAAILDFLISSFGRGNPIELNSSLPAVPGLSVCYFGYLLGKSEVIFGGLRVKF
jgi:hypothetical protein